MHMYIARILYPVRVLGPGNRIGIWFDGCPRRCDGCSNPELWEFDEKYEISFDDIKQLISSIKEKYPIDGFTITGGDPFFQYDALKILINFLETVNDDIIVYTGYMREELVELDLTGISVLIDGPYVERLNTNCALRGSENQTIYILDPSKRDKYENYLKTAKNQIQNFESGDGSFISVGIHKPMFNDELNKAMKEKGIDEYG